MYYSKKMSQVKAIEQKNKLRLLEVNPNLTHESGIYFLTREDEDRIKYFYIGQSVDCIQRLCSHLVGYQHIDLSIKKRGLYSKDNPYGWKVNMIVYPKDKLDEMEKYWILIYMQRGYQARYNKTAGGQGTGKEKINEYRPQKGYRDGLAQGRKNLARELKDIMDKHLIVTIKQEKVNNKVSQRQLEKFKGLLEMEVENDNNRID